MKILCDESGYITSYALEGELVNGIEAADLEDVEHFQRNFTAYRIRDSNLVFDEAQAKADNEKQAAEELRQRREHECFPVINRGQLWYEGLTAEQKAELAAWYQGWLDITETHTIPEKPAWLSIGR